MRIDLLAAVVVVVVVATWIVCMVRGSKIRRHGGAAGVTEMRNLLTADECAEIREMAGSRLLQSSVYTPGAEQVQQSARVSRQCWMSRGDHPAFARLSRLASRMSGLAASHQEDIQIAKYDAGGYYKSHFDACHGVGEDCERFVRRGGQRYSTLLVYLNEGMRGGETWFPVLGRRVVPREGSGVHFINTTEDGEIVQESLHGGQPVLCGEKWILTIWTRLRPFDRGGVV